MVPDQRSSMVKLFKKVAELADQQSGQTGPSALLHAPVALSDNNSDSLLNQKHNHKLAQLPPIHAVSFFSKIFKRFHKVILFLAAWGNWSDWGACVNGNKSRSRTCENATNGGGAVGAECAGDATETCGC